MEDGAAYSQLAKGQCVRMRRNLLDLSLSNRFIVISYKEMLELKAVSSDLLET